MSQLKQIVENSLRLREVPDAVIASVDTLIKRSILRLNKNDFLHPRTKEFTSVDEKNVKKYGEKTLYYYELPIDFRAIDSFYVYDSYPYFWVDDLEALIQKKVEREDSDNTEARRYFTIYQENFDSKDKGQKWLVAIPFPEDDDVIRLRYHTNGKSENWDWIDEDYWEAVISEVESILGLVSPDQAEEQRTQAVKSTKEMKGSGSGQGFTKLRSSYFGGRARPTVRQKLQDNNR